MITPKRYKERHRILSVLNSKTNNQEYVASGLSYEDWCIPVDELCTEANLSKEQYKNLNSLMFDEEEIGLMTLRNIENVHIRQAGMTAFNEKKYLKEGRAKTWHNMNTIGLWVVSLLSLSVSFYTCNQR